MIAKAEKIDPITVFEKWNSSMIFGAVTEIVFRPLSAVEGLIEWTKHSFMLDVQDKGLIAAHFDRVAALAKAVPCVVLDYPRNYDVLPEVLHAIRAQVLNASPSP